MVSPYPYPSAMAMGMRSIAAAVDDQLPSMAAGNRSDPGKLTPGISEAESSRIIRASIHASIFAAKCPTPPRPSGLQQRVTTLTGPFDPPATGVRKLNRAGGRASPIFARCTATTRRSAALYDSNVDRVGTLPASRAARFEHPILDALNRAD